MSRKHYVAVAAILAEERQRNSDSPRTLATIDRIARDMATEFKRDNGRFDRDRFYTAAGVEEQR
jgi:hypothetical protein